MKQTKPRCENAFVDLDKTLIKSDYLLESFVKYFSQNIFAPLISIFVLLKHGKVGLKISFRENQYISGEFAL